MLDKANTISSIGRNEVGQLGDGTTIDKNYFAHVTDRVIKDFDTGENFVIGIDRANTAIYAWGRNDVGQLGDGTTIDKSSLTLVNSSSWTIISAGQSHVAGVTVANTLYVWGRNQFGQLGDGTTVNKSSPVQITTYKYITDIYAGGKSTYKR